MRINKLRIRYKILLAILGANIMLAASLFLVNSWTFRHGFIDYVNQLEEKKLDPLIEDLTSLYQSEGNWDWVHDNHQLWREVINRHLRLPRRERSPPNRSRLEERRFDRPRPPPPEVGPISIDRHILLADSQHELIIGRPTGKRKAHWKPIEIDGNTIGYVGFKPRTGLSDQLDQIFSSQQQKSFAWAALGLLLISSIIAFPLASRLVKPILSINGAAKKLASGDYNHRVRYKSSDELGELANSFNLLAKTLDKNLISRQQWISDISHELRTPVSVLQGEIEALQDGVRSVGTDTLASLHAETTRLTRLIEDLNQLVLSDQGALSYQMEEIDVVALIENCIDKNSIKIYDRKLTMMLDTKSQKKILSGDPQRLSQLFTNLLQNSIRYTDTGGRIRILFTNESNNITINWEDSSPGVTDDQLLLLFNRLYRVDHSRSRKFGGSGLGLSICKKIVEAHNGTIKANHSKLGGLNIQIEFPAG